MEEAGEADAQLALGAVLDEVERLGHGAVHVAALDGLDGVEVLLGLDQLDLQAGVFKPAPVLGEEEGGVVRVEEPLEAEAEARHGAVQKGRGLEAGRAALADVASGPEALPTPA